MTRTLLLVGLLFGLAVETRGAVFDLAPPPATYAGQFYQGQWSGGVYVRRGVILEDVGAFDLQAIGIEINPTGTTTLTATLYNIVGVQTVGSVVASNSVIVNDLDRGFYDVALSHSFSGSGNRYLLDITWNSEPSEATFYDFEGLGDFAQPIDPFFTVGPIRVIDGKDGISPGDANYVLSHFRITTADSQVPEPATIVMFGFGAVGLGFIGYRRRKLGR